MNNYIKNFAEKWKPVLAAVICLVLVFVAGFSVGQNYDQVGSQSVQNRSTNTNYTTKPVEEIKTTAKPTQANAMSTEECKVKGSKSKIYHLPGGSFYNRTNAAQCFATEDDAISAGYTKSSR